MQKPKTRNGGDKQIRDLLARYGCPTPFHKVRTQFLGNIATPRLEASPTQVIKDLWGGELPEFEGIAEVNTFFQELMSLWNHLTKHQSRSAPFRLTRETIRPTKEDFTRLCRMRCEELEGFLDGLYGSEETLDLPERAAAGMGALGEIRAIYRGAQQLLEDPAQSPSEPELAETLRNVEKLTPIAEKELHAVVLACVRGRRQTLSEHGVRKPTVH
ncbi:MAG TPA: hypothetical protein PLQ12_07595 [Candidatus Defluviicoccus seviourii]|nr:hypothetical protein [Candidatus Defluviicoccus seviourii]